MTPTTSSQAERPQTRAVRVSPAGLRAVRSGHPWIYESSVRQIKGRPAAGDVGIVFDDKERVAAVGLIDPASPLRIRVLGTGKFAFNATWLQEAVEAAMAKRTPLQANNTGMRLVNGEGDGLGGLIIDAYDDTVVLKLYTEAWLRYLPWIQEALTSRFETGVLRRANNLAAVVDEHVLWGDAGAGEVVFTENGLRMQANVLRGHKTGHFFDQRDNRARAAGLASGQTVLDVFACTGGFGLNAAAAGARSVTLTDLSQAALSTAVTNFELNGLPRPTTVRGDAFDVLADRRADSYGLVIVDPPTFASRSNQEAKAIAAYRRLARLAYRAVAPGGTLVQASCSTHVSAEAFRRCLLSEVGNRSRVLWETAHALDHPVTHPEGAYLKAIAIAKP